MVVQCSPQDRRAGDRVTASDRLRLALDRCARRRASVVAATIPKAQRRTAMRRRPEAEPWAVTAWGELYEIFPEVDPLVAGQAAESHTHVTALADFSPLGQGDVAIVLRAADGSEETFPRDAGEASGDLRDRGHAAASRRVRPALLGSRQRPGARRSPGDACASDEAGSPGGLADATAPHAAGRGGRGDRRRRGDLLSQGAAVENAVRDRVDREGELAATRVAPARVVARPGGDRRITAPADGVLQASPFPHPGLVLRAGAPLFALTPRLDPERSRPLSTAKSPSAQAELALAQSAARRARELASGGVVSAADLEGRRRHWRWRRRMRRRRERDAATARRARGGGGAATEAVVIGAPFDGAVAAVAASAGQAVEAGDELGRFIASGPPWIEAWVAPEAVAGLDAGPDAGEPAAPERARRSLSGPTSRRVWSRSRRRSTPAAVGARSSSSSRQFHRRSPWASRSRSSSRPEPIQRGIVVPAAAVIDDAGVAVVYVQPAGETMRRREVQITGRAGGLRLVTGLAAGETDRDSRRRRGAALLSRLLRRRRSPRPLTGRDDHAPATDPPLAARAACRHRALSRLSSWPDSRSFRVFRSMSSPISRPPPSPSSPKRPAGLPRRSSCSSRCRSSRR